MFSIIIFFNCQFIYFFRRDIDFIRPCKYAKVRIDCNPAEIVHILKTVEYSPIICKWLKIDRADLSGIKPDFQPVTIEDAYGDCTRRYGRYHGSGSIPCNG